MNDEKFYPIPGFGKNTISESGQVISRYGKRLNYKPQNNGYIRVKVCSKNINVHRLVAMTFIPNPDGLPMVNHKDGNKLNNHVSNLEWCTIHHNNEHAQRTGLLVKGRQVHTNILDEIQVRTVFLCTEVRDKDLAKYFKMDPSNVYRIRKGKSWKHLKLVA